MSHDPRSVSRHYDSENLCETILRGLRAAGKNLERLTPEDLQPVDQFHIGGRDSTLELTELANLPLGVRVLDAGGGIGGPARTLVAELDCHVTVLDLSESFCQAGTMLTELTGLSDQVSFQHGDALSTPFPDGSFDVVWTQHSSMNINDKEGLYAEFHRVLRPGGRLAIHEIMAGRNSPVRFPAPWARQPEISFLRTPAETRLLIAGASFQEVAWVDVSQASIEFWRKRLAASPAETPLLGLHLLLGPEWGTMPRNTSLNLEEGRIVVFQGVFDRV